MRADISEHLIHFTKGDSLEAAYHNLKEIIHCGYLLGTNNFIKGSYLCVCFSEAPIDILSNTGLVNPYYYSRYSPFGFLISKDVVFNAGGRPVIYQPESEYLFLPESHRWRHVTFNLSLDDPIDFTWEREWRIKTERFNINSSNTKLVVPDSSWGNRLIGEHDAKQDGLIYKYKEILDCEMAEMYRESFQWEILTLN